MSKQALFDSFAPRYEEVTPVLRLQRFDDILGGEAEAVEEEEKALAQRAYQLSALCDQVAQKEGITEDEARSRLLNAETQDLALVAKYSSELMFTISSADSAAASRNRLVTLFMTSRAETLSGDQWEPARDWSEADTKRLPRRILEQLEEFIKFERNGWPAKAKEGGARGKRRGFSTPSSEGPSSEPSSPDPASTGTPST